MKAFFMPTYLVGRWRTRTHAHTHSLTHSLGNKTWYVQNQVGLRKKSNGPGCHVSAFVSPVLGFGLHSIGRSSTYDVLRRCNYVREREKSAIDNRPKSTLCCNPAIRCVFVRALCVCLMHDVR